MPKYKEIKINLEVTPEVILGNVIREAMTIKAQQDIKSDTEDKKEE